MSSRWRPEWVGACRTGPHISFSSYDHGDPTALQRLYVQLGNYQMYDNYLTETVCAPGERNNL